MSQKIKNSTRRTVANEQQDIHGAALEPEEPKQPGYTELIAIDILSYVKNTEIPLLAEYAAQNDLHELYFQQLAAADELLDAALRILETKKRAALERSLYSGELNATVGVHLIKGGASNRPRRRREATVRHRMSMGRRPELGNLNFQR